jgi:hypothetical protein
MATTQPNPQTPPPSTEEALPGVDLTVDPVAEQISRATLGPDATEAAGDEKVGVPGSATPREAE